MAQSDAVVPEWTDEDLPVLRSIISEESYLRTQFITLIIMNKAKKAEYQGNENLGQCTVPLMSCATETGTPFEVEVTLGGRSQGRVTGIIQMTFTQAPAEGAKRRSWMIEEEEDGMGQRMS